ARNEYKLKPAVLHGKWEPGGGPATLVDGPKAHDPALGLVKRLRIGRRLRAFRHAVIAHHGRDPQPVVGEHAAAPRGLAFAVMDLIAPGIHRRLVAPERQR